jgi:hypothetical protein
MLGERCFFYRDVYFCTNAPRIEIASTMRESYSPQRRTHSSKAAPDGATNTAERLHECQPQESAPMFQEANRKEGGPTAQTLPPQLTQDDSLPIELREHLRRLRLILPVISVSVLALNRQNAELDHDVASVLSQHACEPLDSEIEHLESILASCAWRCRQREARV